MSKEQESIQQARAHEFLNVVVWTFATGVVLIFCSTQVRQLLIGALLGLFTTRLSLHRDNRVCCPTFSVT